MIFSIAMGAEYLSCVKSIGTFAPTFYGYIISVLASVDSKTERKRMSSALENCYKAFWPGQWSECWDNFEKKFDRSKDK